MRVSFPAVATSTEAGACSFSVAVTSRLCSIEDFGSQWFRLYLPELSRVIAARRQELNDFLGRSSLLEENPTTFIQ